MEEVEDNILCPNCGLNLDYGEEGYLCEACNKLYYICCNCFCDFIGIVCQRTSTDYENLLIEIKDKNTINILKNFWNDVTCNDQIELIYLTTPTRGKYCPNEYGDDNSVYSWFCSKCKRYISSNPD